MLEPGLIACLIATLVDSLRSCNCVDRVLVDFDGGRVGLYLDILLKCPEHILEMI